ncbi:MAG: PH domain-containing protein [Patescibacteria group bacterium]|jgi:uncharacterized membrane protein YdbT with pleckstrin-like domain
MFETRIVKYVKEDEHLVMIVRRFWLSVLLPASFSLACSIASFFFLVPLFRKGTIGVVGFFVLLLFGILLAVRTAIVYAFNAFLITDKRIIDIDQRGFFDRTVSECAYTNVQDVSIRMKGMAATLFRYGSILIQTAGTTTNLELSGVHHPERIQEVVSRLIEESQQTGNDGESLTASELLHLAQKIKEGLSVDEFRKLISQSRKGGAD